MKKKIYILLVFASFLALAGCDDGRMDQRLHDKYMEGYNEGYSDGYEEGNNDGARAGYEEALDEIERMYDIDLSWFR